MDLLDGIGIDDGTLPFRIAVLEDAWGRSLGVDYDWPMVATESLAAGLSTPALVSLASVYSDTDSFTIRQLVLTAAAEIGLRYPSPAEAIRTLGMIVNQALLNDSITPVGALTLVESLTDHGNLNWDLYVQYAPVYDWDEEHHFRAEITDRLKADARELIGGDERTLCERILEITGPRVAN